MLVTVRWCLDRSVGEKVVFCLVAMYQKFARILWRGVKCGSKVGNRSRKILGRRGRCFANDSVWYSMVYIVRSTLGASYQVRYR